MNITDEGRRKGMRKVVEGRQGWPESPRTLAASKELWSSLIGDRCFCNTGRCTCFNQRLFMEKANG